MGVTNSNSLCKISFRIGTIEWKIIAGDGEFQTESDIWEFTVVSNSCNDPNEPNDFYYSRTPMDYRAKCPF